MSEQQHIQALTKIYEAFGRGDIGYILDQLADDVHWFSHIEPVVPSSGDWSSKAKVAGFFQALGDNVDVTSFTPTEFVAEGDALVSTGGLAGTARPTGKAFDTAWIFVWKFQGDQVVSYEQFHDWKFAEAFR